MTGAAAGLLLLLGFGVVAGPPTALGFAALGGGPLVAHSRLWLPAVRRLLQGGSLTRVAE